MSGLGLFIQSVTVALRSEVNMQKKLLIVLLLLAVLVEFATAENTAYTGRTAGNDMKNHYGSKSKINTYINKPALGVDNRTFQTTDGTENFDAKLMCSATSKAVSITYLPAGGGDYNLFIRQDLDMDGTLDSSYQSTNISGICSGGIVSCTPGTWNNCTHYAWVTDNTGKISLTNTINGSVVTGRNYGTCQCSNNSCGMTFNESVFSIIGVGISNSLMQWNSQYLVSKAEFDLNAMTLNLYGQSRVSCAGIGGTNDWSLYGEANPAYIYEQQGDPTAIGQAEMLNQTTDDSSPFSLMNSVANSSYNGTGATLSFPPTYSCSIRNNITIDSDAIHYYQCNDPDTFNGKNYCLVDSRNNTLDWERYECPVAEECTERENGSTICNCPVAKVLIPQIFTSHYPSSNGIEWPKADFLLTTEMTRTNGSNGCITNWNFISSFANLSKSNADCSPRYVERIAESFSLIGKTFNADSFTMTAEHWDSDRRDIVKDLTWRFYVAHDIEDEGVVPVHLNNCTETDGCTLKEEKVCSSDGSRCIKTVSDGMRLSPYRLETNTGDIAISTIDIPCETFIGNAHSYVVCYDGTSITQTNSSYGTTTIYQGQKVWPLIKREYQCQSEEINIDVSNQRDVVQSTQLDGNIIRYEDNGVSNVININGDTNNCTVPVCTVQYYQTDTQEFSNQTNAGGRQSLTTEVRTCQINGNSQICPADDGATVVEDCTCSMGDQTTGFTQAITQMSIIEQAVNGMICSQTPVE